MEPFKRIKHNVVSFGSPIHLFYEKLLERQNQILPLTKGLRQRPRVRVANQREPLLKNEQEYRMS